MLLSPRGGSPYGSFSPHPHLSSHPPHSHSTSSSAHHFPPPSLHSSSSAEPLDSSHPFHPPHLHPSSSLSSPTSSSSPLPLASPDSQWGSSGKLKQLARSIFERAYGLNGRAREDHSSLCEEVMRLTACSQKSFEELVYGHSYDSELCDLRAQVPTYRPREAKKRVGGRSGKKKDEGPGGKGPLLPLFHSPYPGATTPVSASRYELTYGVGAAVNAPRRKSLDASFLGPYHQQGGGQGMGHHGHSASASGGFPSGLSAPFFAQGMGGHSPAASSPTSHSLLHFGGEFEGGPGSHFATTPSHSTLRHRANFSSAAAAAAAAADSVVAYVANTPTSAVMSNWTAPSVIGSPKHSQQAAAVANGSSAQHLQASTAAVMIAATATTSSAPAVSSQSTASASSASLAAAPLSSSLPRSAVLVSSPSNAGATALAASTTLAPVTLASIKSTSPAPGAGLSKLSAPSPSPSVPSDSSRSSSRSTTPLPPSPSNQPPRPVSISIPNSPLVSNEEEGESEGESLHLPLSGGSGDAGAKASAADDDEDPRALRKRKKKEKRATAVALESKGDDALRHSLPDPRDETAAYSPGYLAWAPSDSAGKRGGGHRDERKERSKMKPFAGAAVHPHPLPHSPQRGSGGPLLMASSAVVAAVEAPTSVDFVALAVPAFEAAAFPALVGRAAVSCLALTLLRLYTTYVSSVPSPVDYHTALALFLALTLISVVLLTSSSFTSSASSPSSLSSLLSSHLTSYLRAWEMVAHDDSAQLLAAYAQVQQLTMALVHSLAPHATATLDFLDAAHRQLHLDQGYSLLVHQLISHADAIRTALRSLPSHSSEATSSALPVAPSAVIQLAAVALALFAYALLPLHSLTLSLLSLCTHLLLPYLVAVTSALLLLVGLEERRRQRERVEEVQALLAIRSLIDTKVTQLNATAEAPAV